MEDVRRQKIEKLAKAVLELSRQRILVNLRFLEPAINAMTERQYGKTADCMGMDGRFLYYDPEYVLREYQKEKNSVIREYLHLVVHGIFRHFFVSPAVERSRWNLACDMAAEYMIGSWKLDFTEVHARQEEKRELDRIQKETGLMNAEKIYSYLKKQNQQEISRLEKIFRRDDHSVWYADEKPERNQTKQKWIKSEKESVVPAGQELEGQWKEISQKIQVDLEIFMRGRSLESGDFLMSLKLANRRKQDYSTFLKKFSRLDERMKINDEEFDYNFYTYGMQLYGNMPLIEPLEYQDIRVVKTFVIALDTSGSIDEERLRKFLEKTYQILSSFKDPVVRTEIHLIQCDAAIQKDIRITSQEQLECCMDSLKLCGRGGTDFRPVFEYVEELRKKEGLAKPDGLLYFTDGIGIYPKKKPEYPVAFVFDADMLEQVPEVPAWGIRYLLDDI